MWINGRAKYSNLQTLEDKATTAKEGFEAQAGQAVSNDPFIQSMISDTDTFAFFDESPYINRLRTLFGEDFSMPTAAKYKQVDEAYTAIPNAGRNMRVLRTNCSMFLFQPVLSRTG